MMMERLFQTRCSLEDSDEYFDDTEPEDHGPRKMLRRETAIELPVTPSKSNIVSLADSSLGHEDFAMKNERQPASNRNSLRDSKNSPLSLSSQNSPRNSQYMQSAFLNPTACDGGVGGGGGGGATSRLYKKSCESLQKNSSTDTEYSLQPYRFIKQSSNETNSSFNIDNSSITNDLSIDGETSLNSTVIEMVSGPAIAAVAAASDGERGGFQTIRTSSLGSGSAAADSRPGLLKGSKDRQGSKDGGAGSVPDGLERAAVAVSSAPPVVMPSKSPRSARFTDSLTVLGPKSVLSRLKESSSTSTEEGPRDAAAPIPCISTNLVQDEIAKLSSNIKSSTDEDTEPPFNETMC